jgi:phosphoribosylamine---glycine ligase
MDTKYNVLLLGGGGREHAMAWKLNQSPLLGTLYIAPGNPGTAQIGTNVSLDASRFDDVTAFCEENSVDLVVVGPEAPLVNGIADHLDTHGIAVFGPRKTAAMLEGSKEYAKEFMVKYNIPTADYAVFQPMSLMTHSSLSSQKRVIRSF